MNCRVNFWSTFGQLWVNFGSTGVNSVDQGRSGQPASQPINYMIMNKLNPKLTRLTRLTRFHRVQDFCAKISLAFLAITLLCIDINKIHNTKR